MRLWTKIAGTWRYTDSYFTPASLVADFVYPVFGSSNVNVTKPLTWTAVPGAEAYSLAVGFVSGGHDLVNVSELHSTTYLAPELAGLPANVRVFARLGTKVQGIWRYAETTFAVLPIARLTYPLDGAVSVRTSISFFWTALPDAQAYYLYVGTAPGTNNVVNSGELAVSSDQLQYQSHPVAGLPILTTLYVRLWTKTGNVWSYVDSHFTTA